MPPSTAPVNFTDGDLDKIKFLMMDNSQYEYMRPAQIQIYQHNEVPLPDPPSKKGYRMTVQYANNLVRFHKIFVDNINTRADYKRLKDTIKELGFKKIYEGEEGRGTSSLFKAPLEF
jgi:hypothetical protein